MSIEKEMDKIKKLFSSIIFDPSSCTEICIERAETIKSELDKMIEALKAN